ncbi:transmembrane emp24 domain-containing protein p24delta9-like [Heracleum sosnowskyi]|uniref:Transmembrane emp24 domain-containing protein p24delta9-like n=1 Tax=Heracleum sosnowskyi TaxID=360622 RepID=A0AAD8MIT3_9APIA|nr:transmembrane emp24 domain-containing protein p24delta9-like [Heracleum sosnowskyi]
MVLKFLIFLATIHGLFTSFTEAVRFDLESGSTKCISEDIKSNSMTVGNYRIVNPNEPHHFHPSSAEQTHQPLPESHKLTVRVTATSGNSYHYADHVQNGQFSFQAVEAGDYMTCFWAVDQTPPATLTIDFDWKSGVATKDWSNVAKKGSIDAMEIEVKKLYETVTSIHEEMFYLREREEEMQELNKATNSKMGWLSLLSLMICLSVSGMQLWHLKSFFEKKKLI